MDGKKDNQAPFHGVPYAVPAALACLYALVSAIGAYSAVTLSCSGSFSVDRPISSADSADRAGVPSWRAASGGPPPGTD